MTPKEKFNGEWHKEHLMPKNPTREERIEWHVGHSEMCGCRPVPPGLTMEVAAAKKRTRSRTN
jgi:hypothetical protein